MKTAVNWQQRQNSLVTDPRFSLHSGNRKNKQTKPKQNENAKTQSIKSQKQRKTTLRGTNGPPYRTVITNAIAIAIAITNFSTVSHYRYAIIVATLTP